MNRSRVRYSRFVVLLTLVAVTAGCRSARRRNDRLWNDARHASYVSIATAGVTIKTEDGDFEISAGRKPVLTPFKSRRPKYEFKNLIGKYPDSLDLGARKVRVTYPGMAEPLYGVLAFLKVHPNATEPNVQRTYRIEVPQSYASGAVGGLVQVVYRPYSYSDNRGRGVFGVKAKRGPRKLEAASWVLWLSDAPFPVD